MKNNKKIKDLFYSEKKILSYEIPSYQREFYWQKDDLEIFLLQIENYLEKKNFYFLGFVILKKIKNGSEKIKFQIIDGQQRMLVFSLFMICFCLFFNNFKEYDIAEKIKNYIFNKEDSEILKLNFNNYHKDAEAYSSITGWISGRNLNSNINLKKIKSWILNKSKENKTQIFKNFKFIWNFFEKTIDKISIKKYFNFFEKMEILKIEISEDYNIHPQSVFESLNSTGRPLNLVQLFKNYVLMGFSENDQDILEKIKNWEAHLNNLCPNKSSPFKEFLYVYIKILEHKKIQLPKDKSLYWKFRRNFPEFCENERRKSRLIFNSLSKNVAVFCCTFLFKNFVQERGEIKEFVENELKSNYDSLPFIYLKIGFFHLSSFGSEFKIVLHFFSLLFYQAKIESSTCLKCIRLLSCLELFLRIIKDRIGQLSEIYSQFIKEIGDKANVEIKNVLLFETNNKNNKKIDEIILEKVKNFCIKKLEKVKFYSLDESSLKEKLESNLKNKKALNLQNLNKSILEFFLALSENKEFKKTEFNLEHIKSTSRENKKQKGNKSIKLGNLILLEKEINQEVKNFSFKEKKEKYKKSKNNEDFKSILSTNDWNEEHIEKRTSILLEHFIKKIIEIFSKN